MNKRLYKFSELTGLGACRETLRVWRKEDKDFPKPVYKKFYDIKVFEQYLDKKSGLKPSEPDYMNIFREDLRGEHKGGLPYQAHP